MDDENREAGAATADAKYAARLQRLDSSRWRRVFNVQAPYRWNIRRLRLGRTLDVGCGLGRNLTHLGGNGVGVDHNAESIATARARGLTAFTVDDFPESGFAVPESFDSLLLAHVIEHVSADYAVELISQYLPYLKRGGRVCAITPQESGYRSDSTHVTFVDFNALETLCDKLDLTAVRRFSFPLPRFAGKFFRYNEFVVIATAPVATK